MIEAAFAVALTSAVGVAGGVDKLPSVGATRNESFSVNDSKLTLRVAGVDFDLILKFTRLCQTYLLSHF